MRRAARGRLYLPHTRNRSLNGRARTQARPDARSRARRVTLWDRTGGRRAAIPRDVGDRGVPGTMPSRARGSELNRAERFELVCGPPRRAPRPCPLLVFQRQGYVADLGWPRGCPAVPTAQPRSRPPQTRPLLTLFMMSSSQRSRWMALPILRS